MALCRFGGGVSEIRGSIAGNVFSRSKAGAIIRNRAVPVNPNTPLQSLTRSWMQAATDGFQALPKADVDAWNAFASTQTRINRLGEPYVPSGKQLFVESYMNNLTIGATVPPDLALIEANPNLPALEMITPSAKTVAGVLSLVKVEDLVSNFGDFALIQATPPLAPSISNFSKYYRTVGTHDLSGDTATLTTDYKALFGDGGAAGQVIGFRASAVYSQSGFASEWVYNYAIIVLGP